jgi:NAD(P)-dependent dehydrogenase (short-subunit alcohol dehydrogenase family)
VDLSVHTKAIGGARVTARLLDRTALVTGSTSGIGQAIALALAAEGAHVVVSGRDHQRGEVVVASIRQAGGKADLVVADLAGGVGEARRLAEEATALLGGAIDVLVNNAGVFPGGATAEVDEDTFDLVYTVNVKAPFFLTAAIAPAMAERGRGAIVNIGSWVATRGIPSALYSSSKASLELLTKAWASEFGSQGVRVNAVSPGVIATDGTSDVRRLQGRMADTTPAGRLGRPEEIAAAVVFLAGDEATFIHGVILPVDGGKVAV